MDDKNLDHLYRSRFDNLGVRPAPRNWDRIFRSLEVRRRRKRRALFWKSSGIAAVFMITLGIAWMQSEYNTPKAAGISVSKGSSGTNNGMFTPSGSFGAYMADDNLQEIILGGPEQIAQISPDPKHQALSPVIPNPAKDTTPSEQKSRSLQNSLVTQGDPALPTAEQEPELSVEEAEAILLGNSGNTLPELVPASKKWAVGPRVAPVFYGSIGGGSPLDPRFNANPRSGKVNMSFGMAVAYQLKPRLKVRSGLHKVEYGYDTESVEFSASPFSASALKLKHVDYDFASQEVVVKNGSVKPGAAKDINAINTARGGNVRQELSYLEVPLEIQYELVDRKLGIDFIGGFSSMFLTGNAVSLRSEDRATPMGEATNVNWLNLSSNLGLGIRYAINPGMQLRVEPMFKYHWNTFSGGAEGFRPYSMGVYSGLNIRF